MNSENFNKKELIAGFISRGIYFLLGFVMGFVFSSCSILEPKIQEEDLTRFFIMFQKDAKKYGHKLDLERFNDIAYKFESLQAPDVGICRYFPPEIKVDPKEFYFGLTEGQRKILIYHEIGHCYCRRDHYDLINPRTTCPDSLMNSYVLPSYCIKKYMEDYLKEFFKNC